jgi:catechol 2,3-dioxygenase-like lactoylglutathione lyase family enzyme
MDGLSHFAIGVTDMDASLHFYRDLLGLEVCQDVIQDEGYRNDSELVGDKRLFFNPQTSPRRIVRVRYGSGDALGVLVISEVAARGHAANRLDGIGVSHFAWWVDGVESLLAKLEADGVPVRVPLREIVLDDDYPVRQEVRDRTFHAKRLLTCIVEDPDGILVQLDELVSSSHTGL